MNFSAILDISSFFIGMIINLLLIALICYYFKRKYENLEIAQNEQAKVLYQLLQQNVQPKVKTLNEIIKDKWDHSKELISDSDSETSDSESDSDESVTKVKWEVKPEVKLEIKPKITSEVKSEINSELKSEVKSEIKTIRIDEVEEINLDQNSDQTDQSIKKELKLDVELNDEKDYSKMTIKQLKRPASIGIREPFAGNQ
jgi:hypothetical protein